MSTRPDTIVAIVDPNTGLPDMTVGVVGDNVVDLTGATAGEVITVQPDGSLAAEDLAQLDAMEFKGVIDASANPNYPAASAGHVYRISVAGKIGGASGTNVEVGDLILAIADNAGGTQVAVGTSWSVEQANIDGAVVGPTSAAANQLASFNGTSGKLIKDSGLALDTDGTLAANSDVLVPSQKATKTYADGKVIDSIADADTTHAPSRNTVFDALALKAPSADPTFTGTVRAPIVSADSLTAPLATGWTGEPVGKPSRYVMPAGTLDTSVDPANAAMNPSLSTLTSGTPRLVRGGFAVPTKVTNISFVTGSAGANGPTHWWGVIVDTAGVVLAVTADQLTAAIGATTVVTLAFTAPTVIPAGPFYYGIMVAASVSTPLIATVTGLYNTVTTGLPIRGGNSTTTGSTTAPAVGGSVGAPTAESANRPWFWLT